MVTFAIITTLLFSLLAIIPGIFDRGRINSYSKKEDNSS